MIGVVKHVNSTEISDSEITMICTNLIEIMNFLRKKIAFKTPLKLLTVKILYPARIL